MKNEIGGYFELEENTGKPLYENMVELNNGRNCLRYLIRAKQIKKIFLPAFLCDVVFQAIQSEGIDFETYKISKDLKPLIHSIGNTDFILIVNFYGQISNDLIKDYKYRFKNVIIDNTHAFYQKPVYGVDTIYSCRKYFGVPDGGYLATDVRLKSLIEKDVSSRRMGALLGRYEFTGSEFYETFLKIEDDLDREDVKMMSKLTQNLLKGIDYERISKIRKDNFELFNQHLKKKNQLKLMIPDGPFMYPFYQKNGNRLKEHLIKHQVFIPTLWPNVLDMPANELEYDLANNVLPLPVDQRYGRDEIEYIIKLINKF